MSYILVVLIWAMDAFSSTQIFNEKTSEILMTLDLPFHFGAEVMIAYVWSAALNSMKKPVLEDSLKKLRIPMGLFLVALFAAG